MARSGWVASLGVCRYGDRDGEQGGHAAFGQVAPVSGLPFVVGFDEDGSGESGVLELPLAVAGVKAEEVQRVGVGDELAGQVGLALRQGDGEVGQRSAGTLIAVALAAVTAPAVLHILVGSTVTVLALSATGLVLLTLVVPALVRAAVARRCGCWNHRQRRAPDRAAPGNRPPSADSHPARVPGASGAAPPPARPPARSLANRSAASIFPGPGRCPRSLDNPSGRPSRAGDHACPYRTRNPGSTPAETIASLLRPWANCSFCSRA